MNLGVCDSSEDGPCQQCSPKMGGQVAPGIISILGPRCAPTGQASTPTACPCRGVSSGHTPTCLMHCRRSLVCWMCLSIEFILAVSLGSTREP